MNKLEVKAVCTFGMIMMLRMLGVFMILPIFALEAPKYHLATEHMIGIAVGSYGLTQALLQIPFGYLSDKISRKKVILVGLAIFAIGSFIAGMAESVYTLIFGRAVQGAGAIGSVVMAQVADSTRIEVRSRAIALVGMSIGMSFGLAMILGPALRTVFGLSGIFYFTGILALLAFIVMSKLPAPATENKIFNKISPIQAFTDLKLVSLYFSVFILHAILAAMFLVVPLFLNQVLPANLKLSWVYLGILSLAFALSFNLIGKFEKNNKTSQLYYLAFLAIFISLFSLYYLPLSVVSILSILLTFFVAFCSLEANLPSMLSVAAPTSCRGLVLGIYSSSQFLGIFVGGMVGGLIHHKYDSKLVIGFCLILAGTWLIMNSYLFKYFSKKVKYG